MSNGLAEILRYFLLALLWLFFLYASRMVIVDVRRSRREAGERDAAAEPGARRPPPRLRVVEPKALRGKVYDLAAEVTLGRSPSCTVALEDDTFASSLHARVFMRDGAAFVEDLGSTNGTYVNEERIGAATPIDRGDVVRVGGTVLEVRR